MDKQPYPVGTIQTPARAVRTRPRQSTLLLDLLFMLTWREIAIKYKQSVMGFFWAILMPCLIVAAGLLVRVGMSRMSGAPLAIEDIAGIMVKSLPWAFVVSGLRFSSNSLIANSNLVTRANCPRIVFPFASILSALFDLLIAAMPLVVILVFLGTPLTIQLLWVVPLMFLLVALVAGLGVILATGNLFYRDVKYIVEVVLTFAIFFTPVFYEAEMLGEWQVWIMLNPVAPILEGLYSAAVLGRAPDLAWLAYSAAVTLGLAGVARLLFHRYEPFFADRI